MNDNNGLTHNSKSFFPQSSRINCAVAGHIAWALVRDPFNVFVPANRTDESTWWMSGWGRYKGLRRNGGGVRRAEGGGGEIKTTASNKQSACVWNMEIAVGDNRQQGSCPSAGLPDYCSVSQRPHVNHPVCGGALSESSQTRRLRSTQTDRRITHTYAHSHTARWFSVYPEVFPIYGWWKFWGFLNGWHLQLFCHKCPMPFQCFDRERPP